MHNINDVSKLILSNLKNNNSIHLINENLSLETITNTLKPLCLFDETIELTNPLVNPKRPSDYFGKNVIVINVSSGSINTIDKIGKILSFDKSIGKYELSFSGGWCGHYTGEQLKLLNISLNASNFLCLLSEKLVEHPNINLTYDTTSINKNKLEAISELIELGYISIKNPNDNNTIKYLMISVAGDNYCEHFF
jgi:hypothetical protein